MPDTDYAKLDWKTRRHHARFERFVEANGLPCQECGGSGGEIEPILDYGQGPWIECGWCEGTGRVTPWLRGRWLQCKRQEARP